MRWCAQPNRIPELSTVVDVLAHVVMKDGAASDMPGDTQSPVIHTEEQL